MSRAIESIETGVGSEQTVKEEITMSETGERGEEVWAYTLSDHINQNVCNNSAHPRHDFVGDPRQ